MQTLLEFTEEPNVKELYYKYGDQLKVVKESGGSAYFQPKDQSVHMDPDRVAQGSNWSRPYQTAFHEFGHNIDWLAVDGQQDYMSTTYKGGILKKTIKDDWASFKMAMFRSNPQAYIGGDNFDVTFRSVLRSIDGKDGVFTEMSHRLRNGTTTIEAILNDPDYGDDIVRKMLKSVMFSDEYTINIIKSEGLPPSATCDISDIIEFCTKYSYPLGLGHGTSYWRMSSSGPVEFFAEVCDSKVASPASMEQMRRIFPNAVKVVEEMLEEMVK